MTETESRTPVPDPTILTTQQLLRELAAMEKLMDTRIRAIDKGIEVAFRAKSEAAAEQYRALTQAIDKAERATAAQIDQQRTAVDAVERSLREQILTLDSRMTRSEAAAAGRSQITAPVWGLIGAVATGVLVSVVLAFLGAKAPAQAPAAILMPATPEIGQ